MTPKEKAQIIVNKMWLHTHSLQSKTDGQMTAKLCALICVDEIIKHNLFIQEKYDGYQTYDTPMKLYKEILNPDKKYWQDVKSEINNL